MASSSGEYNFRLDSYGNYKKTKIKEMKRDMYLSQLQTDIVESLTLCFSHLASSCGSTNMVAITEEAKHTNTASFIIINT